MMAATSINIALPQVLAQQLLGAQEVAQQVQAQALQQEMDLQQQVQVAALRVKVI